jgi:hypothetical protein
VRPLGSKTFNRWCGPEHYKSKLLLLKLDPESIDPHVSDVVVVENDELIEALSARQCTSLDPQPHPSNGEGSLVFDGALLSKE